MLEVRADPPADLPTDPPADLPADLPADFLADLPVVPPSCRARGTDGPDLAPTVGRSIDRRARGRRRRSARLASPSRWAALTLGLGLVGCLALPTLADAEKKGSRAEQRSASSSASQAGAPALDPAFLESMEWREVGPYRGGRSAAVAGLADDREVYYFGATGGGVWKTTDAGLRWEPVSDGYFGGSIGAVAVSEWDPNVVYVGTGEKTVRGNVSHGDGMWKSVDAGATWSHVGLRDTRHVSRIRIHPKSDDVVYVCAMGHLFGPNEQRGVYRSRDGGETWSRSLFVNENAGCVDLAMDPKNPRILYAAFWRVLRTPWSLESGGEGSTLWKSIDGGESWTELTRNEGLPEGTRGIAGITVSPTNTQNLYAIIEAEKGGVFRSRDGGETWSRINDSRDLRQRAWYYTRIQADPADEESVYVLNVGFHHSKDGGKSFERIRVPHGDNHDLWIDPGDPLRMIQSNDGGANVSTDGGQSWSSQSNQPTAQMYRVSTDNAFPYRLLGGQQDNSSVRMRHRSFTGGGIGVREWQPSAGCECGHIVAKPDDPEIVFGGCYGGSLEMVNHRTGERRAVDPWPDDPMGWGAAELKYRFQWNFPIFFSAHDPDRLYTAAQVLFVSDDLGATWTAISPDLTRNDKDKQGPSGGPITKDNTSVEYYATIFAALESPHEKGVLWTGSDDGLVHLSRDGGETWENVTPSGLPEWTQINSIEAHPFEKGGLYLAGTRYKLDDFRPYLYRTTDYGATWQEISTGIPDDHFTRVVRADPDQRGLLYAGTERGVYVSLDDGASWQSLQLELPMVPITDLQVKEKDLVAATQGRGFWILDDLTPLHHLAAAVSADALDPESHRLHAPRAALRLPGGGFFRGGGRFAGQDPPNGVVLHYYLADDLAAETELELEILEAETGEVVRTYRRQHEGEKQGPPSAEDRDRVLSAEAGAHRVVWDLRYPGPEDFPGMVIWNGFRAGPKAVPGEYRARLTVGEWTTEVPVRVEPDPRSTSSLEDVRAQFEFQTEIGAKLTETHRAIGKIRDLREQLGELKKRLPPDPESADEVADESADESTGEAASEAASEAGEEVDDEGRTGATDPQVAVRASVETFEQRLGEIEKALYQTQNRSRQDPLNFPIRLNDKLSGLLGVASRGDFRPTAGALAVRDELVALIDAQLGELDQLWEEDLPALERQVRSAEVPVFHVEEPVEGEDEEI